MEGFHMWNTWKLFAGRFFVRPDIVLNQSSYALRPPLGKRKVHPPFSSRHAKGKIHLI
jgi:hypothetical protein